MVLRRVRASLARLRGSLRRRQCDRDILEELEAHIQMQTDANIRDGMAPQAARRAALLASGGIQQALEQYRDWSSNRYLDRLVDRWDCVVWKWSRKLRQS